MLSSNSASHWKYPENLKLSASGCHPRHYDIIGLGRDSRQKDGLKDSHVDPNVQQRLGVTGHSSHIPSFCFGLLLPKNPDQCGHISIFYPSFLHNVRIRLWISPWHYGCLFCFSSVGSCLIFNFSDLSIICQMETVRPNSKDYLGLTYDNMQNVPNLPSKASWARGQLPLCCSLVHRGHPAAWSRAHAFRDVPCPTHRRYQWIEITLFACEFIWDDLISVSHLSWVNGITYCPCFTDDKTVFREQSQCHTAANGRPDPLTITCILST